MNVSKQEFNQKLAQIFQYIKISLQIFEIFFFRERKALANSNGMAKKEKVFFSSLSAARAENYLLLAWPLGACKAQTQRRRFALFLEKIPTETKVL